MRKLSRDNLVSVEFNPSGFSVKALPTKTTLMTSSSPWPLYPFYGSTSSGGTHFFTSGDLWHQRLGHPGKASLASVSKKILPDCNNVSSSCTACQLGRQPRLPFSFSNNCTTASFQLIHCDLWTAPVVSFSGYHITLFS